MKTYVLPFSGRGRVVIDHHREIDYNYLIRSPHGYVYVYGSSDPTFYETSLYKYRRMTDCPGNQIRVWRVSK